MKLSKIKQPRMVESSVMKKVHRDDEEMLMHEMQEKQKKMAKGGMIKEDAPEADPVSRPDMGFGSITVRPGNKDEEMHKMASGGMVDEDSHDCIASAIMARRRKMAEGGMVDLSQNADEEPNLEDQLSYEALKKENYSESEGLEQLDQPEDSNLIGDMREDDSENKHDRISEMRRRMKSRQG